MKENAIGRLRSKKLFSIMQRKAGNWIDLLSTYPEFIDPPTPSNPEDI